MVMLNFLHFRQKNEKPDYILPRFLAIGLRLQTDGPSGFLQALCSFPKGSCPTRQPIGGLKKKIRFSGKPSIAIFLYDETFSGFYHDHLFP